MLCYLAQDKMSSINMFFSDNGDLATFTTRNVTEAELTRSKHPNLEVLPTAIAFEFHPTHILQMSGRTREQLLQDEGEVGAFMRILCTGWCLDGKTLWVIDREQKLANPMEVRAGLTQFRIASTQYVRAQGYRDMQPRNPQALFIASTYVFLR